MENKIRTGSKILDKALNGGYEKGIITTIYGPAGSGKTILAMLAVITTARNKKNIIYIDTESSFSTERLKQIAKDYKKILEKIFFFKPVNFEEQKKVFEKIKKIIENKNSNIGLIVIDTISMLYRLELVKKKDASEVNKALVEQISYISEIAKKKNLPVIVTNQVYSVFDERDQVNMVGGDILKYRSKTLIELQITPSGNRKAILRKHRSLPYKEIVFKIVEGGIIGTKESKGFSFF